MQWLKNKMGECLVKVGARLMYGWWPESMRLLAVPPAHVRKDMERHLEDRRKRINEIVQRALEQAAWPEIDALPPINTVSGQEWN